jgi:hypothetical protein
VQVHAPDFVLRGEPYAAVLVVPWRIDPQCALTPEWQIGYRYEIDAAVLSAEDSEVIDLAVVIALPDPRIGVVSVVAAQTPSDRSTAKATCLALNLRKYASIVDHEVVPCVFTQRHEHSEAELTEHQHDGESRTVSNVDRMLHASRMPELSAGPCPEQTTDL